ncbi:MAG: hypothetical protein SPI91_01880 [Bacilli bacterium]|uniref:hypothetical protein n=1 Tax=Romboutsia timonensis TaxID=1776391 RepID=UPI002A757C51|nr:hypothetical protein [Romboutsia timonensis]MDY2883729.1 hypothetical protein [Romboutsia timonensis]MDY6015193.1 hypothetical protein [Bacilli bacterium]
MKKGLMICLLVISSLGVGVLGTNIYYNNLPKPQIKQQTATNKEIEKEDTVEDKKEIVTNEDEETKEVTENKAVKETNKTNDTNNTNKTQQSIQTNTQIKDDHKNMTQCATCKGWFGEGETRFGQCWQCWKNSTNDEETWHCQYCGVKLNANNQYGEIDMCNYCHYLYCEKPYENKTYEDSGGFSE